jgi:hypothetical protein
MSEDVDEKPRKASDAIRQGPHAREEMPQNFAPVKQADRNITRVSSAITLKFNDKKFCSEMLENRVLTALSGSALTDDS